MSFTDVVKEEIIAGLPKKNCCHRACLMGILYMRGRMNGRAVAIPLHGEPILALAEKMITEQFSRTTCRLSQPEAVQGEMISFSSKSAADYLLELGNEATEKPFAEKCSNCHRAFLDGTFLAAGRVSDPHEAYRLEFSCGKRRENFATFLRSYALEPKSSDRKGEKLLYFRDSSSIEDLFAHMGATQAAFLLMDSKIERGLRNDANRLANCDANNIDKAVSAAMRQTELIQKLIEENKLSFLPPELESTAHLRLQYAGLSLTQLAAVADPPMTKSGLNHRLKKIESLAEELLKQKKGDI